MNIFLWQGSYKLFEKNEITAQTSWFVCQGMIGIVFKIPKLIHFHNSKSPMIIHFCSYKKVHMDFFFFLSSCLKEQHNVTVLKRSTYL